MRNDRQHCPDEVRYGSAFTLLVRATRGKTIQALGPNGNTQEPARALLGRGSGFPYPKQLDIEGALSGR
jgi:hypothetical protein